MFPVLVSLSQYCCSLSGVFTGQHHWTLPTSTSTSAPSYSCCSSLSTRLLPSLPEQSLHHLLHHPTDFIKSQPIYPGYSISLFTTAISGKLALMSLFLRFRLLVSEVRVFASWAALICSRWRPITSRFLLFCLFLLRLFRLRASEQVQASRGRHSQS